MNKPRGPLFYLENAMDVLFFKPRHSCSLNIILSPGASESGRRFCSRIGLGLVPGVLPRSTCLTFSTLEMSLTSLGAFLSAPVRCCSPSACNGQDFYVFNHSCPGKQRQPVAPSAQCPIGASQGFLWVWLLALACEVCFHGKCTRCSLHVSFQKDGESEISGR